MISKSKLRYLMIAPRKVRLVADLIRKQGAKKAQNILNFTRKKAARPLLLLLNQAMANAENKNPKIDLEQLFISEITVDEGPRQKKVFPRSRGRADIMLKKSSHVTIILDQLEKEKKTKGKSKVRKVKGKKVSAVREKKDQKEPEKIAEKKEAKKDKPWVKRSKDDVSFAKKRNASRFQKFFRRKAF